MSVKLLTENNLEFLLFKGEHTGLSESTLVKMPHCWKSHVTAHYLIIIYIVPLTCEDDSEVSLLSLHIHYSFRYHHSLCFQGKEVRKIGIWAQSFQKVKVMLLTDALLLKYVPYFRHIVFGVDPVGVCVAFCVNRWIDFDQICTDTYFRQPKGMVRISWPWPNFKITRIIISASALVLLFVCTLNLWTIGWALTKLAQILIWDRQYSWPWPNFQVHQDHI